MLRGKNIKIGDLGSVLYSGKPGYWSPRLEDAILVSLDPPIVKTTNTAKLIRLSSDWEDAQGGTWSKYLRQVKQLDLFNQK